ncbi:hypothetical protein PRIO_2986 [Paenibacillus riograndensis SBR5]|uniref:Uncharacterized protein n=1 Tax=Paenibacillus riograndensis SBR5 TaxID=1073571 RepID=A0A0E4CWK5_9BACL|nr:hypothetical protein PRIO_2986 [Paenibacillus riograndensis SBR5]
MVPNPITPLELNGISVNCQPEIPQITPLEANDADYCDADHAD